MRLAILDTHPIQYSAPLYRRLSQEESVDVAVYYCSDWGTTEYVDPGFGMSLKWDRPLLDGYEHHFLPNLRHHDSIGRFGDLVNPGIVRELDRRRYDALWVNGYRSATQVMAIAAARARGVAVLYRSESSLLYDERVPSPWYRQRAKRVLLRSLFAQVSGFLAIGSANRDFYRSYGVPDDRIFHVPYAVDNDYFAQEAEKVRRRRSEIRVEIGVPADAVVFLFAAKMTPLKRTLEVLDAYAAAGSPNAALLMVGDGPLRVDAERRVKENDIAGVTFTGFVNQSELPQMYAAADVLIRPDGVYKGDWGLTVNEAMASGTAVIATDAIAASRDLIADLGTGIVVRFEDQQGLSAAIGDLARDPQRCQAMGARAREVISTWSYEECVTGTLAALRHATSTKAS